MKNFCWSQGSPSAPIRTPFETEFPICLQRITAINPWGPTPALIHTKALTGKIDFKALTWTDGLKAVDPKLVDAPPPPC